MNRRLDQRTVDDISRRLAELLAVPVSRVSVKREPFLPADKSNRVDLLASASGFKFAVEWKAGGSAAEVGMAVRSVLGFVAKSREKLIPLVAAPYMGEVGQRLCAEAEVCWLDLSGNANLVAPGLRVNIEGKANQFKRPGRPRSVFASKSSRIARWLLIEPQHAFSQRELAKTADLDEGFTSRIVRHLEEQRLIAREANGAVKVADPQALLRAWREAYDFSRHHIVRGHIAARSSDEILRRLSAQLTHDRLEHAATGLAGAWLLNQFAGFRLVAFYVNRIPSAQSQQAMGFREEPRGENVWLVVPNDQGVFDGAAEREGVRCVHPVQVYLDLKDHPERSAEASEALRRTLFGKEKHA
jgi:hypothetical protein